MNVLTNGNHLGMIMPDIDYQESINIAMKLVPANPKPLEIDGSPLIAELITPNSAGAFLGAVETLYWCSAKRDFDPSPLPTTENCEGWAFIHFGNYDSTGPACTQQYLANLGIPSLLLHPNPSTRHEASYSNSVLIAPENLQAFKKVGGVIGSINNLFLAVDQRTFNTNPLGNSITLPLKSSPHLPALLNEANIRHEVTDGSVVIDNKLGMYALAHDYHAKFNGSERLLQNVAGRLL